MSTHKHSVSRSGVSFGALGLGPKSSTFICGTIVVLAAFALETRWVATPIVGVPVGLWLVALATLVTHLLTSRSVGPSIRASGNAAHVDAPGAATKALSRVLDWPQTSSVESSEQPGLFDAALEIEHRPLDGSKPVRGERSPAARDWMRRNLGATAMELAGVPGRQVRAAKLRIDRLTERLVSGQPRLSVGIDLSESERAMLVHAAGVIEGESGAIAGVPVAWMRAPSGLLADGADDARRFDVLLRRGTDARSGVESSRLTLFVSGAPGSGAPGEAGVCDWGRSGDLCYASLFPARLDADRVTMDVPPVRAGEQAKLITALAGAAAVLSRSSARTSGRSALTRPATLPDAPTVLASAMNTLADALLEHRGTGEVEGSAAAIAARVLGCYSTTIGVDLPAGGRLDLARLASDKLPADPGATLRLAAAQLAVDEREAGKQTLVRAFRQIRAAGLPARSDTLAFVLSEAEHGTPDPMTLGRLCAGICLAWATTPDESLDYLQDDLIDDLKHAGWLIGREKDLSLLREVIVVLERELLGGFTHVELKQAA